MHVSADCYGSIHLQQVWLGPEDFSAGLYDPKGLLFGQTTLSIEMSLEEVEIGLRSIVWRPELFIRGGMKSRSLNIYI